MRLVKHYPTTKRLVAWAIFEHEGRYLLAWPTILGPKRLKHVGHVVSSGPLVHYLWGDRMNCPPGRRCDVDVPEPYSYQTLDLADLEECDTIEQMFESFVADAEFYLTREAL